MKETIILESLTMADLRDIKVPMVVIYKNPKDFPGWYVGRIFEGASGTPTNCVVQRKKLEDLREDIRKAGFQVPLPRAIGDDPVIVECWM